MKTVRRLGSRKQICVLSSQPRMAGPSARDDFGASFFTRLAISTLYDDTMSAERRPLLGSTFEAFSCLDGCPIQIPRLQGYADQRMAG
jgi:hypothetical protein